MTPKDMKEKTLFPDMPMFQNINGYPLSMEYKEVEEVTIEGYPVRIPKDENWILCGMLPMDFDIQLIEMILNALKDCGDSGGLM